MKNDSIVSNPLQYRTGKIQGSMSYFLNLRCKVALCNHNRSNGVFRILICVVFVRLSTAEFKGDVEELFTVSK